MVIELFHKFNFLFVIGLFCYFTGFSQNIADGKIKGKVDIDTSWSPKVYLSYLPRYNDIFTMSNEMIIAESKIDSQGNFEIDLDILPEKDKLYRLHIPKKSDSKYSLMIGQNENYLLLIANKNSKIAFSSVSSDYPFNNVVFTSNAINQEFHQITLLVNKRDSMASESDFYKRKFIREKAKNDLLKIADSSSNALVSLYAIFKSDFETDYNKNKNFYQSYLDKWSGLNNEYLVDFRTKISKREPESSITSTILSYLGILVLGFLIGKFYPKKRPDLSKLSVQERKVLEMLKKGASNKEISEEFNIGISTVKSHVSSILSKMNVKSRKELMKTK